MAREAAQAGGSHGDDDTQITPSVRVEQHQDGGALAEGNFVPEREGGWFVRAEATDGGLGQHVSASQQSRRRN